MGESLGRRFARNRTDEVRRFRFTVPTILAIGLLGGGLFFQQASANQIDGAVSFQGTVIPSNDSDSGIRTISFINPGWTVVSGLGNYFMSGTSATFTAFSFAGSGTGVTLSGSGIPEGTFTFGTITYSFELLALVNATTTSDKVSIIGTGIAHITGFDDTPASWVLEGSGQDFTFNLSTSTATPAPDSGSAVALLGIALVGLVALHRGLRAPQVRTNASTTS